MSNPQYLLGLEGSGDTIVKLERLDGKKDQGGRGPYTHAHTRTHMNLYTPVFAHSPLHLHIHPLSRHPIKTP